MKRKMFMSVVLGTIFILFGITNVRAQHQLLDLFEQKTQPNSVNLTDLINTGINIVAPELPEVILHRGLKVDDVRRSAREGIEAVGWSQNQGSPYYVLVSVTEKSSSEALQIYSVQADWGYDQIPVVTTANGMNSDVSFARTVVITDSNFTAMTTAVRELSQKAAMKLRMSIIGKTKYGPATPNKQLESLY